MNKQPRPIEKPAPSVEAADGHMIRREEKADPGDSDSKPSVESKRSGLNGDISPFTQHQDTPGRPKSASSRQQTRPEQATQTGSAKLDSQGA